VPSALHPSDQPGSTFTLHPQDPLAIPLVAIWALFKLGDIALARRTFDELMREAGLIDRDVVAGEAAMLCALRMLDGADRAIPTSRLPWPTSPPIMPPPALV
jgi:hypothetical protein